MSPRASSAVPFPVDVGVIFVHRVFLRGQGSTPLRRVSSSRIWNTRWDRRPTPFMFADTDAEAGAACRLMPIEHLAQIGRTCETFAEWGIGNRHTRPSV
jgi:hypothetical protein